MCASNINDSNPPIQREANSNPKFFPPTTQSVGSTRVKIGIVTCAGPHRSATESGGTNETLTLLKSVIISAKIYFVKEVQFHIFVDSDNLEKFLERKISEYTAAIGNIIKIDAYFYNVFKSVPANRIKEFVNNSDLPCTYVRLFFPDVLSSLDSILYLDTDVVITGNIGKIWEMFQNMSGKEIVALAPNNEPNDTNYGAIDRSQFGNIPHILPKGETSVMDVETNKVVCIGYFSTSCSKLLFTLILLTGVHAGIFYMNLVGLRSFQWTEKVLDVYRKYIQKNLYMNDQQLINIILHDNREMLKVMPCNYSFQYLHCERGLTCTQAVADPMGIQILHGAGHSFQNKRGSHYLIYESYRKFDLGVQDEISDLLMPLKQYYTRVKNESTCGGVLGPLIFKDLSTNSVNSVYTVSVYMFVMMIQLLS